MIGLVSNPLFLQSFGVISMTLTLQTLQTLVHTSQEIYGFIANIKSSTSVYHKNINVLLIELDLESEILLLESLLKEINIEKYYTQTLAICLNLMKTCLLDIHQIITQIHDRVIYNNKLWVSGYGTFSYKFDDIIVKLSSLYNNLIKRKNNLFKILSINNHLLLLTTDKNIDCIDTSVVIVD